MNTKSSTKTFFYKASAIFMISMMLLAAMPVTSVFATAIGFFSPSAARSNGPGWINSTNAFSSNDLYATAVRQNKILKLSNFNITPIQGGATIDGIEVTVEGHTLGLQANVSLTSVATGSTNGAAGIKTTALNGTDSVVTLGGPNDTWGKSWVSSDFTNANFKVQLKTTGSRGQTISLDHVQVKVYYTLGDTTLVLSPVSGNFGGTTTMTATLTATTGGAALVGETVSFSLNGTTVGSAITDGTGVATLANVSLVGINAGDYPYGAGASFAGFDTFGPTSITADFYVHGTPTTLTVAPSTFTYSGSAGTTNFSATLTETGSGNPVNGQTVNFYLGDVAAGSGVTDASGNVSITGSYGVYDAGVYNDEVVAEFVGALIIEPSSDTATLTVNPVNLTVSGNLTAGNKMYDGNATASFTGGSLTLDPGVISPDVVTLNTSGLIGTFSDKNVGTSKTVQISGLTLNGADAGNYSLTQPTRQADITTKPITVTAVTNTKVYDGTTSAAATPTNSGLAAGDSSNFTESYTTKHVGIGNKTLVPAGVVNDGNNGDNYSYTYTDFTTGSITTLPITITAVTNTKVYDGTTSAAATPINSGLATGDTASFTEAYSDMNAGIGNKTLVPAGVVSDGNSGNNYSYTYTNFTTGTINKANATVTVNGYTGTYDGSAHGATLVSATGVNAEDLSASVSLDSTSFTNVPGGTANWTFTDVTGNYNNDSGNAAITINKANATITVNGYTGTYDGSAHGATLVSATGVNAEDLSASVSLGSSFTNAPGGTANWTFSSTNYNNDSGNAAITINKVALTVTANNQTMLSGSADPAFTFGYSGFVNGETATALTTAPTCGVSVAHSGAGVYAIVCAAALPPTTPSVM